MAHPSMKCSHEENREKICMPCGQKIAYGKINNVKRFRISESCEKLIKFYICETFSVLDSRFPVSICGSCRLSLFERKENITRRPLQDTPNYQDIVLSKETRANNNICNCYICSTARYTGHVKVSRGAGKVRNCGVNVITASRGLYARADNPKVSKNVPMKKTTSAMNMCKKCFQIMGRGKRHSCSVYCQAKSRDNLLEIVNSLPEKQQEQVASSIIKQKINQQRKCEKNSHDVKIDLSTRGQKAKIVFNPSKKKDVVFSSERLDNFQVKLGVSNRQMKKVTNFLRSTAGRKAIPTNFKEHMSKKSEVLADIYKQGEFDFETEKKIKEKRPVIWTDAEELVEVVLNERQLIGNHLIKVMADGGQGFFKISMSILPADYSSGLEHHNDEENYLSQKKKRKLYSEGGTIGGNSKFTSVHRLIMLCIVPQIKETYENIELLFTLTKVNNISFKFVSDFKLLLTVNGQQTASSMYPCPYCFISLSDLRAKKENRTDCDEDSGLVNTLKTYGHLKEDYEKFSSLGKNKKFSQECHSTVHCPLFDESDDTYVIQKCMLPELHLLQGFVNHLFWTGLVPLLGRERALIWPKKLKLIPKNYHGEIFEGNACRKLLKESDKLLSSDICGEVGELRLLPFIGAFKAMNKVVNCCFTTKKVDTDVESLIKDLKTALISTGISQTLKLHVTTAHLKECLQFINNDGLGVWSEQAGESIHRDFKKFWDRYMIHVLEDSTYTEQEVVVTPDDAPVEELINAEFGLFENLTILCMPYKQWSGTFIPGRNKVVFAEWDDCYITKKRIVIHQDMSFKVLFGDAEIKLDGAHSITGIDEIETILKSIDSMKICSGIKMISTSESCLGTVPLRKPGQKGAPMFFM